MQSIFQKIMPFILLGIAIVAFIFGLVLLSYLFIFGALVGLVLFAVNWLKEKFLTSKKPPKLISTQKKGQTFDHDEFK